MGYCSLKEQYTREMTKLYDNFDGNIRMTSPEEMDRYIEENLENTDFSIVPEVVVSSEDNTKEVTETEKAALKEKEEVIIDLSKEVKALREEKNLTVKERIAEAEKFKESDKEHYKELREKAKETETVNNKLSHGRYVVESKLSDLISQGCKDSELIESTTQTYMRLFEEDDFQINEDKV